MITSTALMNPKFLKRIKRSVWLARLESIAKRKRATVYVKNRKGNNALRIDYYPSGELVVFAAGMGMKNYASLIIDALDNGYSKLA